MEPFVDELLKLYGKDDHPTHGIYKISLDEVADAWGYLKGFDRNMRPYYGILHELTKEYQVEKKEFIIVPMNDDRISYETRFYTKHALLMLAMICDRHKPRNWRENHTLLQDHKRYINQLTGHPQLRDLCRISTAVPTTTKAWPTIHETLDSE